MFSLTIDTAVTAAFDKVYKYYSIFYADRYLHHHPYYYHTSSNLPFDEFFSNFFTDFQIDTLCKHISITYTYYDTTDAISKMKW